MNRFSLYHTLQNWIYISGVFLVPLKKSWLILTKSALWLLHICRSVVWEEQWFQEELPTEKIYHIRLDVINGARLNIALVTVVTLEMVNSDLTMASLPLHHPTKIITVYVSWTQHVRSHFRTFLSQDGTENDCFKPVLMMTSLVMPDPETGAAGRIHILVECWNAREQMNVLP